MVYLIDAWLECAEPCLRILNKLTGEVCLTLNKDELDKFQEQGVLDTTILYSTNQDILQELTSDLFQAKYLTGKL